MIEIPSAQEVRDMSLQSAEEIDKELTFVRDKIMEAVGEGKTSITVDSPLSPFVMYTLRSKGYSVYTIGGFIESEETNISW